MCWVSVFHQLQNLTSFFCIPWTHCLSAAAWTPPPPCPSPPPWGCWWGWPWLWWWFLRMTYQCSPGPSVVVVLISSGSGGESCQCLVVTVGQTMFWFNSDIDHINIIDLVWSQHRHSCANQQQQQRQCEHLYNIMLVSYYSDQHLCINDNINQFRYIYLDTLFVRNINCCCYQ